MGASCSTAPHEIPPEEMCVRVMMHAQRTASRRNSACSQLSAFVGSNMLQGQPPPAGLLVGAACFAAAGTGISEQQQSASSSAFVNTDLSVVMWLTCAQAAGRVAEPLRQQEK